MAATSTLDPKTVANNYSVGQFANDFSSMAGSRDGAKDLLEVVINGCEWMAHLGVNKQLAQTTSSTLQPIKQGFSIMSLFHHLDGLRDQYRVSEIKDPDQLKKDVFIHTTLGVYSAAEFAMFLNSTGIYVIKEWMKSVKTVFWMALGIFDVVNLYNGVGTIKEYRAQLDRVKMDDHREILESKINLAYLQIIQSATLVAMAAIALVSLVFASMAQGFLFNPVVMLGLSSSWLVLQFVNYFYDKIITHRENNLLQVSNPGRATEA